MGKHFFVLQTIDHARHYKPENKIVIDIPAAVNIFYHPDRIEQHITHVANELLDKWNATFVNKPQVKKKTPKFVFNINVNLQCNKTTFIPKY